MNHDEYMRRSRYRQHYGNGWSGTFIVWVMRGPGGTEYQIGERCVPPDGRVHDVIARIGPIAYEEGQGLERFREQIAEDVKYEEREEEARVEHERIQRMIQREVEARMPKPPEADVSAETVDGRHG